MLLAKSIYFLLHFVLGIWLTLAKNMCFNFLMGFYKPTSSFFWSTIDLLQSNLLMFSDKVLLYNLVWLGTWGSPPASACQVLGLRMWATPSFISSVHLVSPQYGPFKVSVPCMPCHWPAPSSSLPHSSYNAARVYIVCLLVPPPLWLLTFTQPHVRVTFFSFYAVFLILL